MNGKKKKEARKKKKALFSLSLSLQLHPQLFLPIPRHHPTSGQGTHRIPISLRIASEPKTASSTWNTQSGAATSAEAGTATAARKPPALPSRQSARHAAASTQDRASVEADTAPAIAVP